MAESNQTTPAVVRVEGADLISMAGVSFVPRSRGRALEDALSERAVRGELWSRYDASFDDILHRPEASSPLDGNALPGPLPGARRFVLESGRPSVEVGPWRAEDLGCSVLVSPQHGVGVASKWSSLAPSAAAPVSLLELAEAPLVKSWEIRRQLLDQGLEVEDIEPTYPVTGIRLAQGGAEWEEPGAALAVAPLIGEDLARKAPEWLLNPASPDENISRRPDERLFVRSSGALAIYLPSRASATSRGEAHSLARAVQALEAGVLARRILRTLGGEFEQALARMTVFRPELVWRTRGHLLTRFIAVERLLATSLPAATWEGERLLQAVFQRFQLDRLLATTRYTQARFERRLGVVEQQYIIAAAVFTFLANSTIDIIY
jgi:hypothetical protein